MNKFTFANHDELISEIEKKLCWIYGSFLRYETQIYIRLNEDGTGELEQYEDVGGNSWRVGENLYIAKIVPPTFDNAVDQYEQYDDAIAELANVLGMEREQLIEDTRKYNHWDEYDEITSSDVREYIKHNDELNDKVSETYLSWALSNMDCSTEAMAALEEVEQEITESNELLAKGEQK